MDERKLKEIEYYNKEAGSSSKESGSLMGFNPFLLSSYKCLDKLVKENCSGKTVLDFGCGTGIHIANIAKVAKEVIGIDLSEKSLEIARQKIKNIPNAKVLLMDCEKLDFPDKYFDAVFDGGTFSSIDLDKALPEILRVLKPEGVLIGIETFGHNPFTNLKRLLNKKTGKRTEWAVSHIIKEEDSKRIGERFCDKEIYYFHLVSWITFPFLNLPFGLFLLKIGEGIDKLFPFLKKYSFKVVFAFKSPS